MTVSNGQDSGIVAELTTIPANEQMIPFEIAEPWLKVSDEAMQLEGLCFDRSGNLYFLEVFEGRIFKVAKGSQKLECLYQLAQGENPAALKIHKDGRLFICCLGNFVDSGSVIALDPDELTVETIIAPSKGFVVDDMVFASDGSFYFTNFVGGVGNLIGGVYHVSADFSMISPVLSHLAVPNGLALTKDEQALWITEMSHNRLIYCQLVDRTSIPPFGTAVPYHFSGLEGPDSCCVDDEGNLYVALYEQGRVLVFDALGNVKEQKLIKGRETGHLLRTTHPAIAPNSKELIICTNDFGQDKGSWLYKATALADGAGFSYQFKS